MKKIMLLLLVGVLFVGAANAQFSGFFKPLPKIHSTHELLWENGKTSIATKFSLDSVVKSIRPVVVLSADVSDGAQLAGGAGIGYQSNKWDDASQAYITQWSVSAIGLLGTTGSKLTGTGGIIAGIPGTNGIIGIGGGRDFTQGKWVLITGVQLKFN